jgi:hypothetical protein
MDMNLQKPSEFEKKTETPSSSDTSINHAYRTYPHDSKGLKQQITEIELINLLTQ